MEQIEDLNTTLNSIHYLILDPDKSIEKSIRNTLDTIGIEKNKISVSRNNEETIQILREIKPSYLACYFNPKNQDVFKVIDEHKKVVPDYFKRYLLAFSQSKAIYTFAQALEEEIDDYIVEPYSQTKILKKIHKIIKIKKDPSGYKVMLNDIQEKILKKELGAAAKACQVALTQHPRPAMAYYYLARIEIEKKNFDQAIKYLIDGLKFNKEHYRCLLLLHDLYFQNSNFDRAYKVLKKVLNTYPLSTHRVFDIFKSGILSGHLDEIEKYCKVVLKEEPEQFSIIQFCTAGLVICAMNTYSKNENKAIELIKEATLYSQADPKILRNIYKGYLVLGLNKNAQETLAFFKTEDQKTLEFKICQFLHEINSAKPLNIIVSEAKMRLIETHFDEDCFNDLFQRVKKEGSKEQLLTITEIGQKHSLLEV